ncbi:MAG: polyhydroxyalkanoic acid system family protein [Hyphomicrobiaceae bacterium]
MAAPLVVSISHSLGKEEARRRLSPGFTKVAATLPILKVEQEAWTGDRLEFRVSAIGQVAEGFMDVAEDHVRVEVHLPWLLQRMAESIRGAIQARGRILLEHKPPTS